MVLNNQVSVETYGYGVKWQKVDILEDKLIITERHARIPALSRLDRRDRTLSRLVDLGLLDVNKELIRERAEKDLGLEIEAVFKDYDPKAEAAVTVILLRK